MRVSGNFIALLCIALLLADVTKGHPARNLLSWISTIEEAQDEWAKCDNQSSSECLKTLALSATDNIAANILACIDDHRCERDAHRQIKNLIFVYKLHRIAGKHHRKGVVDNS